jgi:hypothetical protein
VASVIAPVCMAHDFSFKAIKHTENIRGRQAFM